MNLANATFRAELYQKLRQFFIRRQVLEVETPLLSPFSCIDAHIDPVTTGGVFDHEEKVYHLQTSPELYMKQLLCEGYPSIFQICKSFRRSERGRLHNPEFTMLEWYRLGFDDKQLIAETAELVCTLMGEMPTLTRSYRDVFEECTGLNPLKASAADCKSYMKERSETPDITEKNDWLIYIMSEVVEPQLPSNTLNFIRHFPAEQSALAEINPEDPSTSLRFELYVNGVELCNGYQELRDPQEYQKRFQATNKKREAAGLSPLPVNQPFLDKMKKGFPFCSGAALGLDRLIMLGTKSQNINEVLEFPVSENDV